MEARGVHICQPRQGSACIQIKVEEAHHDQLEMEVSTFEPANHPSNLCFSVEKNGGVLMFWEPTYVFIYIYIHLYCWMLIGVAPPNNFWVQNTAKKPRYRVRNTVKSKK